MANVVPLDCFMQRAATGIGRMLKGKLCCGYHILYDKKCTVINVMSMCSDVVRLVIQTFRT